MTFEIGLFLFLGLALLLIGGELLVKGASKIAEGLGISPLVIGLTIVSLGTSAPEMAVSVVSSFQGKGDLALANIIGSNIFNLAFILGLCALVSPLKVQSQLVRSDVPIMIGSTILLAIFLMNGYFTHFEASILCALALVYTGWLLKNSKSSEQEGQQQKIKLKNINVNILFIALGLTSLIYGSKWFVGSSTEIARLLNFSERTIGLTIVAIGTSLPELVTSLVATYRGQRDIAVGNVIGSNIYNILLIGGISGVISSEPLTPSESMKSIDIPVALGISLLALPFLKSGHRVSRVEGAIFISCFGVYLGYLLL